MNPRVQVSEKLHRFIGESNCEAAATDVALAILKEHEAGVKTADLCRKHGISEAEQPSLSGPGGMLV